jgi:hypothetical protein
MEREAASEMTHAKWNATLLRDVAFSLERAQFNLGNVTARGKQLKELSKVLDDLDLARRVLTTVQDRGLHQWKQEEERLQNVLDRWGL